MVIIPVFQTGDGGSCPLRCSNMKNKIIELRNKGFTYSQICKILGCSKGTVAYWCNTTTRYKNKIKCENRKKSNLGLFKFSKAYSSFCNRKRSNNKTSFCIDSNKRFRNCISHFRNRGNMISKKYTYKEAWEYLNAPNVKCYLTGTPINMETDSYDLDHIIPVSKGGTNELSNLGVAIPMANRSKSDLTVDEYLELCKKVLEYHGYIVIK